MKAASRGLRSTPPALPKARHRVWIFDLDDTLHDASRHVFPFLHRSMTEYIQRHLRLTEEGAWELRRHYWQRYGATLQGLVKHHGTDPRHFLWHTHQLPDPARMIRAWPGLQAMLRRLPGRKFVLSNAPAHYVNLVLERLGIARFFDGVFSIETSGYRPKPHPRAFYGLLRRSRLDPARCVMVEDSLENLKTAKRLGMRTVWVHPRARRSRHVDQRVRSVLHLPRLKKTAG